MKIFKQDSKLFYYFFLLLLVFIFSYFIYGQFSCKQESYFNIKNYETLDDNWKLTEGKLASDTINLPYNVYGDNRATYAITNTLPDFTSYTHLATFNAANNLKIYIDDTLRYEFNENDVDHIGLDMPSLWVYLPIYQDDSGKEITIVYSPSVSDDVSYFGEVILGDSFSLLIYAIKTCQIEVLIAISTILLAFVVGISCLIMEKYMNTIISLKYMSLAVFNISVWILLNSTARQFIFPSVSISRNMAFLMVSTLPVAFAMYMDSVQHGRYHTAYFIIEACCMINTILSLILHFSNLAGLSKSFTISAALIIYTVFVVMYTLIRDTLTDVSKAYITSAIGIVVLGICSLIQLYFYKTNKTIIVGSASLSVGMLIMMFFATANAIQTLGRLHIERAEAIEQIKDMSIGSMEAMAKTVDSKTPFTADHSARVAAYSVALAKKLGWNRAQIEDIRYAALLHDIGKIGVPDSILNKPGKLTDVEYDIIKSHTTLGADILKNITSLNTAADTALSHHERYDGLGYPNGLKGEAIPLHARLVAITDAYDAMTSKRLYRSAEDKQSIQIELVKGRGTQFDPNMLDAFLELYDDGTLAKIAQEYSLETQNTETTELLSSFLTSVAENRYTDETDFLTGLSIRRVGEEKIAKTIEKKSGCLAFIDLDNLKQINDKYGHTSGDNAIRLIGQLLIDLGGDGITCRLGGDEFLYFIPDCDRAKGEEKAKNLIAEFNLRKESDDILKMANLSMGMTLTEKGDTFQNIFDHADSALYYKKRNGKGGYFFFEDIPKDIDVIDISKN